jgi:hypothetical protein
MDSISSSYKKQTKNWFGVITDLVKKVPALIQGEGGGEEKKLSASVTERLQMISTFFQQLGSLYQMLHQSRLPHMQEIYADY